MYDGSLNPDGKIDQAMTVLSCSGCHEELPTARTAHSCRSLGNPIPPLEDTYKCPDCRVRLTFPDPTGDVGECLLCHGQFRR